MSSKEISLGKVRQALTENKLDAMVASSPANVCYTSGTYFRTMISIPDRLGMVAITPNAEPALIYCTIEVGHATTESWLTNLVGYTEFADRPVEVLARVLAEQGANAGRIGIEKRHLATIEFEWLQASLPKAEFVAVDSIFDRMRAVKSTEEIAELADCAYKTDIAIRAGFENANSGLTELSVAEVMVNTAKSLGALKLHHHTLATGEHGFLTHAEAGATKLQSGDVFRTDLGMTWPGQWISDIARTAFVGQVTPKQADLHGKLEHVQQELGAGMRPGMKASDVYSNCKKLFEQVGLPFDVPHCGHGIGLGLHENPMFHPFDQTPLEAGMIFMLEPLVRGDDGLYHVEDMVEITETDSRIISRAADWSQPMVLQ